MGLGEVSRQCLEEELKAFGYGKHTEKRRKLLTAATKRLQALSRSMYSLHSVRSFDAETNTESDHLVDSEQEQPQNIEEEEEIISIADNEHFHDDIVMTTKHEENGFDLVPHKRPKQTLKSKKKKDRKKRRRWEERTYLKRQKERAEWIHFNEAKWIQHMNISPVTVIPTMPISQIYVLFHVLHPDKIYVAKRNELVGVIDEQILLERERTERKGTRNRNTNNIH